MKKIYALDSFSGFLPEEIRKERELGLTDYPEKSYHYNTYDYVQRKIKKLNLYYAHFCPNLRGSTTNETYRETKSLSSPTFVYVPCKYGLKLYY